MNMENILHSKTITLDPDHFECKVHGKPVPMTAGQFSLLYALMRRFGRVMTRIQIIQEIQGANYPCTMKAVDVQICALRKRIPRDLIEAVRARGYRFRERVSKLPVTLDAL